MSLVSNRRPQMMSATRVFWDVEDFPIPNGNDLGPFEQNIESALQHAGYVGRHVAINVYSDRKTGSKAFWHQFFHSGMYISHDGEFLVFKPSHLKNLYLPNKHIFYLYPREKRLRLLSMISDMILWAKGTRDDSGRNLPINLMVIAKSIPEDTLLVSVLEGMKNRGYNIFLAQLDEDDDSDVALATATEVWLWKSLFEGGEPMEYVTDTDTDEGSSKRSKIDA